MTTLTELRKLADTKGVKIATSRDQQGWAYWLTDVNGDDLFTDDNYFTSLNELHSVISKFQSLPKYWVAKRIEMQLDNHDFEIELSGSGWTDHFEYKYWQIDCRKEWYAQS